MKRVLGALYLVFLSGACWAEERFPPPDFSQAYPMPPITAPEPRADWLGYLDIGLLFVALALAAYFALYKRSRKGIVWLTIFSLAYFGFYRLGCICPIGAIQNVSLSVFGTGYSLPLVVGVFFLLPLIFALFAGRVFCAAVCPLGAIQELVLLKPVRIPGWLAYILGSLPWIYLGFAVLFAVSGSAFIICKYDVFVPFFRLAGPTHILIAGVIFLVVGMFIGRPYCRFFCPYGALLKLISPLSRWRVTVTPDKCIKCRLCEDACPYGQIRYANEPSDRLQTAGARQRLIRLLVLVGVLMLAGLFLGRLAAPSLALQHPDVRLAQQLYAEENFNAKPTDQSNYMRQQNRAPADVYRSAKRAENDFRVGTPLVGLFLGLVLGVRIVSINVYRHRENYEADSGGCVACGRCYSSCPVERARHGDPEAIKILEEYA